VCITGPARNNTTIEKQSQEVEIRPILVHLGDFGQHFVYRKAAAAKWEHKNWSAERYDRWSRLQCDLSLYHWTFMRVFNTEIVQLTVEVTQQLYRKTLTPTMVQLILSFVHRSYKASHANLTLFSGWHLCSL
jgi:hypothetical protein